MVLEEVVEHADDGIGALTHVDSFIDEVSHLSGNGLAAYSENCTLPWCEKVHGAGLEGVVGANCSGQRWEHCWEVVWILVVVGRRYRPW